MNERYYDHDVLGVILLETWGGLLNELPKWWRELKCSRKKGTEMVEDL